MSLRIFVAAAWSWADRVRDLHENLRDFGCQVTSAWAESAPAGDEPLGALTLGELRAAWQANRDGILLADLVIVLADSPGREMHAEAEFARIHGVPIVWVGKPSLSVAAYPDRYTRVATIDEAIVTVATLRASGVVGRLLATGSDR